MADDDTFFGGTGNKDNRTVLMPRPGGRTRMGAQPRGPAAAPPPVSAAPLSAGRSAEGSALTAAATPLLSLAGRLSTTAQHPDPAGLFRQVAQEIQTFEVTVRNAGVAPETALSARYALCTLLDEVVLNTPWGSQSTWPQQTLLSMFHKEAWGGEKFFQLLERVQQQGAANLDLLELMYLCLSMGLQGQYRVRSDGMAQIEAIRSNLYQTLRSYRGEREAELSPQWQGVLSVESPLSRAVPLWVVAAVAGALCLAIYFGFVMALNRASDPVALQIASLGRNLPPLVERQGYVAPARRELSLADLLQPEIAASALQVSSAQGVQTVTLRSLFASGQDEVEPAGVALVDSVAAALNRLPGRVMVVGHTDNVPSRSLRFPSNWHLSKARAETVRNLLAQTIDVSRLSAEPRADSEPLVANDSRDNRAINRRVEILLYDPPRTR
ncbi:MAG: type IVB secretion system protein IcmH/DotU [Pseudomonadota bacterium]